MSPEDMQQCVAGCESLLTWHLFFFRKACFLLVMRSGSFIIALKAVISESVEEIDPAQQSRCGLLRKSCWVYGGIFNELSILKC